MPAQLPGSGPVVDSAAWLAAVPASADVRRLPLPPLRLTAMAKRATGGRNIGPAHGSPVGRVVSQHSTYRTVAAVKAYSMSSRLLASSAAGVVSGPRALAQKLSAQPAIVNCCHRPFKLQRVNPERWKRDELKLRQSLRQETKLFYRKHQFVCEQAK